MNLLFISQGREVSDQRGFDSAFQSLRHEGRIDRYVNLPLFGGAERLGWEGLWNEIVKVCQAHEIDLVFFQFFHGGPIESPLPCVARLKALPRCPTISVSAGDLFSANPLLRRPSRPFVELSSVADVTFLTAMGSGAEFLAKRGAKRLVLLPHGFPEAVFPWGEAGLRTREPPFDVVMVTSRGRMLNPFKYTSWAAFERKRVADALYRRYGKRFGLFGHGWGWHPALQGPVEYGRQMEAFPQGRVVVDGKPPFGATYYASDRPFFVAGSGVPLVQFYTPRFETLFRPEEHVYFAHGAQDVCAVCDRVLEADPAEVRRKALATLALVRERHTLRQRAEVILSVMSQVRDALRGGSLQGLGDRIRLPFFLPEVDMDAERPWALVNWE